MYSLVSAVAKSFATEGRWAPAEIGELTFAQLYSQYTRVLAVLTNPFLDAPVSLDLADIQSSVGDTNQTFNEFLIANAQATLPTTSPVPQIKTGWLRYRDAFRAGYSVDIAGPTQAVDAQLPPSEKTWLYLTKPNTNFLDFYKYVLVSINGFIHRTTADQNGVWVVDGNRSTQLSGKAEIGLLSFQFVSPFTIVPVTDEMLYKSSSDEQYRNRVHVNLGQDITKKSVALVLGGYFHFLDSKTFRRVNDTSVVIDFDNLPLFERYHESRPYLDYSSMPFDTTDNNPSQISVDNFLQDANIAAYMKLSQTFFVVFDNPEMFKEYQYVESPQITGLYVSGVAPQGPLITGVGKISDYLSFDQAGQWALEVTDNYWHHRGYSYAGAVRAQDNIADNRNPMRPVQYSRARFLNIGTDLPVVA